MSSLVAFAVRSAALAVVLIGACLAPALAEPAPPLVSPQWLKENLSNPAIVVLDIRSAIDGGGIDAYASGHIPGAVHSDYDKAGWRVTRDGVPFMLPTLSQLEKLIGEIGIDEDNHVIVVPAGVHVTDFGSAARVYWTLKVAGHPAVSILDGGFAAWRAAAYPVETGRNPSSPKIFTAKLDRSMLASVDDVEAAVGPSTSGAQPTGSFVGRAKAAASGQVTLLDARPSSFFAGKEKAPTVKAYGHIPGARNFDSGVFYDAAANRLLSKGVLGARRAAADRFRPHALGRHQAHIGSRPLTGRSRGCLSHERHNNRSRHRGHRAASVHAG
jgi:thiosulfate/3-mercaptopyruvate sulfurtransferase